MNIFQCFSERIFPRDLLLKIVLFHPFIPNTDATRHFGPLCDAICDSHVDVDGLISFPHTDILV